MLSSLEHFEQMIELNDDCVGARRVFKKHVKSFSRATENLFDIFLFTFQSNGTLNFTFYTYKAFAIHNGLITRGRNRNERTLSEFDSHVIC